MRSVLCGTHNDTTPTSPSPRDELVDEGSVRFRSRLRLRLAAKARATQVSSTRERIWND